MSIAHDLCVNCSKKSYALTLLHSSYPVGVPHGGSWVVLLNSDDWKYGGAMHGPGAGVEVPTTAGGR